MLSVIARVPELQLSQTESSQLADAITRVNAEFDIAVISPKAAALMNLGVVAGGIFIPRLIGMRARKSIEKQKQRAEREQAN